MIYFKNFDKNITMYPQEKKFNIMKNRGIKQVFSESGVPVASCGLKEL
jgi:hypothetical protein